MFLKLKNGTLHIEKATGWNNFMYTHIEQEHVGKPNRKMNWMHGMALTMCWLVCVCVCMCVCVCVCVWERVRACEQVWVCVTYEHVKVREGLNVEYNFCHCEFSVIEDFHLYRGQNKGKWFLFPNALQVDISIWLCGFIFEQSLF